MKNLIIRYKTDKINLNINFDKLTFEHITHNKCMPTWGVLTQICEINKHGETFF